MSLFQGRDWWSTYAGNDEEFDVGNLCISNIDNSVQAYGMHYTFYSDAAELTRQVKQVDGVCNICTIYCKA